MVNVRKTLKVLVRLQGPSRLKAENLFQKIFCILLFAKICSYGSCLAFNLEGPWNLVAIVHSILLAME